MDDKNYEVNKFDDVSSVKVTVKSCQTNTLKSSVSDPSHFDVDPDPDPDPGIHIWEKWIRIRILGSTFP